MASHYGSLSDWDHVSIINWLLVALFPEAHNLDVHYNLDLDLIAHWPSLRYLFVPPWFLVSQLQTLTSERKKITVDLMMNTIFILKINPLNRNYLFRAVLRATRERQWESDWECWERKTKRERERNKQMEMLSVPTYTTLLWLYCNSRLDASSKVKKLFAFSVCTLRIIKTILTKKNLQVNPPNISVVQILFSISMFLFVLFSSCLVFR